MGSKRADTEFKLWQETSPEQRSFLVEVLHWFHYRSPALKRSWSREEAITWELLRAFEILPQSLFLRPFLNYLAKSSRQVNQAIVPLLYGPTICITRYPSLKLTGAKRNCRSDIGLGLQDGSTVWIEAKTAPFKPADLQAQILQQQDALTRIFPKQRVAIVTLLPRNLIVRDILNISWNDVATLLEQSIVELKSVLTTEYNTGYLSIAKELLGRIMSHPNQIAERP